MSTIETETAALAEIMDRVRGWSPPSRIALARRILESLEAPTSAEPAPPPPNRPMRGMSAAAAAGLLRTDRPPFTDEECRQIIEEERWQKYGS